MSAMVPLFSILRFWIALLSISLALLLYALILTRELLMIFLGFTREGSWFSILISSFMGCSGKVLWLLRLVARSRILVAGAAGRKIAFGLEGYRLMTRGSRLGPSRRLLRLKGLIILCRSKVNPTAHCHLNKTKLTYYCHWLMEKYFKNA